ncbi:thioredoxin/PDI [Cryptosporidium canis]|uniref:Thioredoxin/PDI n=1 Tax=Cryptosporidium canis TaxID=195482 RepID=A0A9D5DMH3_9CRYT|nr:thioredoxin/PDI [Cryptosporidium canis]
MPALLACWSVCIVLSVMDLYYLRTGKSWVAYDQEMMESKVWWICGIPLAVYSLIVEISLLVATSFSYMKTQGEIEFDDGERFKEFRSYNSNYAYSSLYESAEGYTSSILSWIDSIGIWNRIVFIMTNFIAIMTCYYLCVGLCEYSTRSVTFLLKSSVIGLALILTWLPGVLSTYYESFKLFGVVFGGSAVILFMMYSRNYQISGRVKNLTSEVMNIRKLTKGEEIINRRIIERYLESGGRYYTISTSPAAIATELEWGKSAIQALKDNNSYFDCNFDQNRSSWTSCVEEKITTYPTWMIGDKTISGLVSPKTIAHMVNINMKELSKEVLSLVHPDDKKEIEDRISDIEEPSSDGGSGEDLDSIESQETDAPKELGSASLDEGKVDLVAKEIVEGAYNPFEAGQEREKEKEEGREKEEKASRKSKKRRRSGGKRHKKRRQSTEAREDEESEGKLAESMYDLPSFRGMSVLNKLEASNKTGSEREVNLIEKIPEENVGQDQKDGLELPSKEEFEALSDKISQRNEEIIRKEREMESAVESEIRDIESDENEMVVGADVESEMVSESVQGGLEDSGSGVLEGSAKLGSGEDEGLNAQNAVPDKASREGMERLTPEQRMESSDQPTSSDHVISEMIQSDEESERSE